MNIPSRVNTIIRELYNRNIPLAKGSDDQRRMLTMIIAEQVCYEFGPKWGTKRADKGRPPSKDSISYFDGTTLINWDWQNGTTREPMNLGNGADITGQVFMPVTPVNHLLAEGNPLPPIDVPDSVLSEVLAKLSNIERQNELIYATLTDILDRPIPTYTARLFGQNITLTPRQ